MKNTKKLIGDLFLIVAENGVGKGTVAKALTRIYLDNIFSCNIRKIIEELASDRKLILNDRDDLTNFATDIRREFGANYIVKIATDIVQGYIPAMSIESIRHPDELVLVEERAERIYIIVVLEAPLNASEEEKEFARMRTYKRLSETRKQYTDNISYEKFIEQRFKEFTPADPNDPSLHDIKGCIDIVVEDPTKGCFILNDSDEETLFVNLQKALVNAGFILPVNQLV